MTPSATRLQRLLRQLVCNSNLESLARAAAISPTTNHTFNVIKDYDLILSLFILQMLNTEIAAGY